MASPVTVNCTKFNDTTPCADVKLANGSESICKAPSSGTGDCECNDTPMYGSTNTACTKDTLKCTDLGKMACGGSSDCKFVDKTCVCDPDKHFVADPNNLGFCVCDAGFKKGTNTPCEACTGN